MNILATNLSVQANATSLKVADVAFPKSTVSPDINQSATPVLDTASTTIYPTTNISNPTYDRPIPVATAVTEADPSDQSTTSQPVVNEAGNIVPDGDTEPDSEESQAVSDEETPEGEEQNRETYSEAELEQISDLKARDTEVVAHERAHASVGGQHTGSPSYSYETGPDGVKYAVSGEVSIDTSEVAGDPQATLQKAQQIKAAALAPAEPSAQDRKVAAKAEQMASQARSDILEANSVSSGSTDSSQSASINIETTVPEHFTNTVSLSNDSQYDELHASTSTALNNNVEQLMNERNEHINSVYQNSSNTVLSSSFQIQV